MFCAERSGSKGRHTCHALNAFWADIAGTTHADAGTKAREQGTRGHECRGSLTRCPKVLVSTYGRRASCRALDTFWAHANAGF